MKITLSAGGRANLNDGHVILLQQTKSAQAAEKKAYLPTHKTEKQVELIEESALTIPNFSDLDDREGEIRIWEIPSELHMVYRDALLAYGTGVARHRLDGEKKYHLDSSAAKKRIVEVQGQLKVLGDIRDILTELEADARSGSRRK